MWRWGKVEMPSTWRNMVSRWKVLILTKLQLRSAGKWHPLMNEIELENPELMPADL